MNDYFAITSIKRSGPLSATLDKECTAIQLGDGLKDICLYLRDAAAAEFERFGADTGQLTIRWEDRPQADDYRSFSDAKLIAELDRMKDVLARSESIEHRMRVTDFLMGGFVDNMDQIVLMLQSEPRVQVQSKFKKELDYIFGTLSPKLLPQGLVTIDHRGYTLAEIQAVLTGLYDHLPDSDKREFRFDTDFKALVFNPLS